MAITVEMRTQITQLYVALFGRAPDAEGLGFWVNMLDSGATLTQIADAMFATEPARDYYPAFLTNGEIVASFYVNVLGRTADAEGLAFWTAKLNAPGATPGSVITEMIGVVVNYTGTDPAGLESQALFLNKVEVAQYYAENDGRIEGAAEILEGVTSDDATVAAAKAIVDNNIDSGDTLVLTTGVDAFTGGDLNDTFVGFVGVAAQTTAQPFDVVDGNAGWDRLQLTFGDTGTASFSMTSVERVTLTHTAASGSDGDDYYVDASSWTGVRELRVDWRDDNNNTFEVDFLDADLDEVTLQGSGAGTGSSYFSLNDLGGTVSVDTITVMNFGGQVTTDFYGLANIPELELSDINQDSNGWINLSVTDNVGTGTDDTLTLTVNNAGAFSWETWTSTNISLLNASGDGVVENLTVEASGDSSIDFTAGTTNLVNVTASGTGDLALWFGDSTKIETYDASALAGDLTSEISSSGEVTVTLGGGDHWFGWEGSGTMTFTAGDGSTWISLSGSGDATVNLGAGNDWADQSGTADYSVDFGTGNDVLFAGAWGGATPTATSVFAGGEGTDTLIVDAADFNTTAMTGVSGFERLVAYGSGTWDLSVMAGITTLVAGAIDRMPYGPRAWWDPDGTADMWTYSGSTVWFDNAASSVTTLEISASLTSTSVDLATDGAANALTVQIGSVEGDVLVSGYLGLTDYETLTFNSEGNDDDAVSDNSVAYLDAGDATRIVVTGSSHLTFTDITSTTALTEIDAGAFTGNLVLGTAVGSTAGIAFIGGSGDDTYIGTAFGDAVNGGAGGDTITLGAAGQVDTVIYEAGDSLVGDMDNVTGFVSGEDTIDLGAFAFSGQQASALINKGNINATIAGWTTATAMQDDFFVSAGVQRGVAVSSDGANTYVLVDANKDGDFTVGSDLVILFTGTAAVSLSDVGF